MALERQFSHGFGAGIRGAFALVLLLSAFADVVVRGQCCSTTFEPQVADVMVASCCGESEAVSGGCGADERSHEIPVGPESCCEDCSCCEPVLPSATLASASDSDPAASLVHRLFEVPASPNQAIFRPPKTA